MTEASSPVVQTFRERLPVPGLSGHVVCVWVLEVGSGSAPYAHRTVPNGSAELVCALGSAPRVVGPRTGPTEELVAPGTTLVGVRLRPGAAPSALGLPASELVDLELDAGDLWGAPVAGLGEAVLAASSPAGAASRLEQEVVRRLAEAPEPDPLVRDAVRRLLPGTDHGVRELASSMFVSERHLRRRCETAVGVAPKVLQRMLRFQRFLALAGTYEQPSAHVARLAAEAGYADQSHLHREALRLDGRPPRALLLAAERHCACAHDHAASYGPLLQAR